MANKSFDPIRNRWLEWTGSANVERTSQGEYVLRDNASGPPLAFFPDMGKALDEAVKRGLAKESTPPSGYRMAVTMGGIRKKDVAVGAEVVAGNKHGVVKEVRDDGVMVRWDGATVDVFVEYPDIGGVKMSSGAHAMAAWRFPSKQNHCEKCGARNLDGDENVYHHLDSPNVWRHVKDDGVIVNDGPPGQEGHSFARFSRGTPVKALSGGRIVSGPVLFARGSDVFVQTPGGVVKASAKTAVKMAVDPNTLDKNGVPLHEGDRIRIEGRSDTPDGATGRIERMQGAQMRVQLDSGGVRFVHSSQATKIS